MSFIEPTLLYILFFVEIIVYELLNHGMFSNYTPNTYQIQLSYFDEIIPFLPWTTWIYISHFVFILCFILAFIESQPQYSISISPNRLTYRFVSSSWNQYLQCMVILLFIHLCFYFFIPTEFPRYLYDIPSNTDAITSSLLSMVRYVDTPKNCYPSLHASTVIASLHFFSKYILPWKPRWILYFWGGCIIVSTLTTKQHFFLDIVSGIFLGWFVSYEVTLF